MTTTTSCNNARFQHLFRGYMKKNRAMMLLMFAVGFFCLPFPFFVTALQTRDYGHGPELVGCTLFGSGGLYTGFSLLAMTAFWVAAAAVVGLSQTAYMHNRRAVDLYHSLPITRPQLMGANYLASFLTVALPTVLNYLITIVMAAYRSSMISAMSPATAPSDYFSWGGAFYGLFAWLVALAGMLSVAFLVATQTGSTFDTLIFSGVILFAPLFVSIVHIVLSGIFLYGYVENVDWALLFSLSPITLTMPDLGMAIFGTRQMGPDRWASLIWLAGDVFLFWAATKLYRLRPSEKAESSSRSGLLTLVVRILVLVMVTPFLGILFSYTVSGRADSAFHVVMGTVIFALLIFFVMEAVLNRGTKGLWKAAPMGAVLTVLVAGYVGVMSSGGLGFETYLPPLDQVESVTLNYRGRFNNVAYCPISSQYTVEDTLAEEERASYATLKDGAEDNYYYSSVWNVTLDDPESIQLVQQLQSTAVQEHRSRAWEEENLRSQYITISYQLQSGKIVKRAYSIRLSDPVMEALGQLNDSAEMNEECNPLQNTSAQDYMALEISGWMGMKELEIADPEQVERLLIALSNDVSRESFAEYVSADKKVVAQVQLLSVQRERYSKEPLTRDFYGDYTIDVTEEYVNTLAALEKLGAGDLLTPAPQEISGAVVIPGWSYTGINYDAESNFYQSVWTSAADRESYLASEDGQEYVQYLSQEEASRLIESAGYIQPMEDEIFLNIMFLDSEGKPGAPLLITSQAMRQAGLEQQAEILERW